MGSISGHRLALSGAVAAATLLLAWTPCPAQDEQPAERVEEDVSERFPDDGPIDEITVVAPRSLTQIKAEIVAADRQMYGLFNRMEPNREYHVFCRRKTLPVSNIKRRICLPQFELGVLSEELRLWGYSPTGYEYPQEELRRKRAILRQKMIAYAEQNPELEQAVYRRAQLERDLGAAQAARKADDE